MATTAESFQDALLWIGRFLRMATRRAAIAGVIIALFALAVWWTTREMTSGCDQVTDEQVALLESLRDSGEQRTFGVASDPGCVDGRFFAELNGLDGDMEAVTEQLTADGLALDREFIGFYFQLWRRCFRFPGAEWERIEVNVWASRGGIVRSIDVAAPEEGDACDALRY